MICFRLRVGRYRIFYTINFKEKIIEIYEYLLKKGSY